MADNKLPCLSIHWRSGGPCFQEVVTMKKHLLIIALITLLGMVVSPVCAYTLLADHSTTAMAANASSTQGSMQQIIQNGTTFPLWNTTSQVLTKWEGTGLVLNREDASFLASDSRTFYLRGSLHGN